MLRPAFRPAFREALQLALNRVGRRGGGGTPAEPTDGLRFEGTDASGIESGFRFETSLVSDTGPWVSAGTIGALTGEGEAINKAYGGFLDNTGYWGRIFAFNGAGDSDPSEVFRVYTKPVEAPTSLSATTVSDTEIELTFTEPSDVPVFGGYQVSYSSDAGATWTEYPTLIATGSSSFTVEDLTGLTAYTFRIRPVNDNSPDGYAAGPWSNTDTATTDETVLSYYEFEESLGGIVQGYKLADLGTVAADVSGINPAGFQVGGGSYTQGVAGIPGSPELATSFAGGGYFGTNSGGGGSALGTLTSATPFTISLWVKTTYGSTTKRILSLGGLSTLKGIQIRNKPASGGENQVVLYDNSGTLLANILGAAPVIADGAWKFMAVVWTGADLISYVNGVERGRATISSGSFGSIVTTRLRGPGQAESSPGTTWMEGTLQFVMLRNKALTAAELLSLYNKGITPY